ncbi:MAG TPA: PAS domain S-box protein, partial [Candidatus Kryptobacter bacterium]
MDLRDQFIRVLEASKLGFVAEALPSSVGLSKRLGSKKYDALIIDYDLAVGDPASILKTAKEIDPFLIVIVVSRKFTDGIYWETMQMGADTYLPVTSVSMKMFPRILLERIEGVNSVREAIDSRHQSILKSYQIEILASLVRKMVETNDLKSVMQEMAEQVVKKLDMKVVSLQRFFPRQQGFAVYGIYPQGKLVKFAQMFFGISLDTFVFPFDPDNCIVDRYTLERKPWMGNDFADVFGTTMPSQAARMIQKFAGVRSIYNAPFYSKDQLLGGIVVGNVRKSFTDEELEAFDAIVHVSSLLFEYNESVKAQIIQNHKLQAIHEISSQLHENLEPEKIFDIIHEKLDTIVPADVVRLFIFDQIRNSLIEKKIMVRKGKRPNFMKPEIPLGTGLLGRAARDRQSVMENNAHLNPNSAYLTGRPDLEHLLAVPITHHGQLLGMIAMTRIKDEPFSETDREALEIFTSQFGIAFHNSQLYENLQRSESLYRLVLENVNDPVIFVGTDGNLLFVNPKFEELTGYSAEEALGRGFDFLIHPDDLGLVSSYYGSRMSGKRAPSRYEFRFVRKSGEVRTVDYNVT